MISTGVISVIIPIYNVEEYLERCIESVVCQTYEKLEIILVDDGSTDGSPAIVDLWAEKDSRIIAIHRSNGGLSSARNNGLNVASGEYIMFVDSDDYVAPDICETLISEMSDSDAECCICGYSEVAENGSLISTVSADKRFVLTGQGAIHEVYLRNNRSINLVMVWGKLFKRHLWKKLQFTPGIYYEDLDLLPDLYLNCKKVICIPYTGYYYLQRVGSISRGVGTDDKRYTDSVMIRDKHIQKYLKSSETELAEMSMRYLVDLIITSDSKGWIPESDAELSRSLLHAYMPIVMKNASLRQKAKYAVYRCFGRDVYNFLRQK